jgi:cellulose synthase/poly-beta-1,6-N-acetylglucosamine synthase-like glycosyltransferase
VDDRYSQSCANVAIFQYVLIAGFGALLIVQLVCSLIYIAKRPPDVKDDDMRAGVMIMVPCYSESDKELTKTIDSVLENDYPDENKGTKVDRPVSFSVTAHLFSRVVCSSIPALFTVSPCGCRRWCHYWTGRVSYKRSIPFPRRPASMSPSAKRYSDANRPFFRLILASIRTMSSPEHLALLLGFSFDKRQEDPAYSFKSLGPKGENMASVYSGVYTIPRAPGKSLRYVVLVKQGLPEERLTPRAGNRGKRDSQLLLFGIMNRLQNNRRPLVLDQVFKTAMDELGLPLNQIEYMMAIDADTRVANNAIKYMVHHMEHEKMTMACCGETQVDNRSQSMVTAIQVFEYYSAHHMKKAFESVFGSVTCLPGCFTMYRLYTEFMKPILTSDTIYQNYSRNDISSLHERNLFELGEDRMLTTLLLSHFPGMKLSFVPEATCWTIVPDTFQILKSQRRRWINSTIHNMCELLKVRSMCWLCFFSMKLVVFFDLLSTFLLPAGCRK